MPEEPVTVTRRIELDRLTDELWDLIATGAGWAEWMVDAAHVEVAPGRSGTVEDAGEVRHVTVTEVHPDESVQFTWWPAGRLDRASTVTITITPGALNVVEILPPATPVARATAQRAWEVRAVSAWARCQALARA